MNLWGLFANNLLPVFLVAATGYVLAVTVKPDPRAVSHVAFYVLAPCLVFQLIGDNRLDGTALLRMVGFATTVLLAGAALTALLARWIGWSRELTSAVVLVVMLPNAGNFGLSVSALAFGDAGVAQASLYFVTSAVLTFTAGVFVASLGRTSLRAAFIGLWRVPAIWAVGVALLLARRGVALPAPLATTVHLLAQACIPVFLVILGLQLRASRTLGPRAPLTLAVGMRLVAGPLLALGLAPLFGLEGAPHQAAVLQSAMPSAVICTVLAAEYDAVPGFVTAAVFLTTLLSPLTLTPLLAYLGA